DDLLHRLEAGGLADERGAPGQDGLDDGAVVRAAAAVGDPVADGGQVDRRGGAMAQAAGNAGPDLALPGQEDEGAAVLDRDAARREAGLCIRLEVGGERRPEAEGCKAHWRVLLGYGWTDACAPFVDSGVSPAVSRGGRSDAAHGGGSGGRAHCLPPSVADSYRLRVASVRRGVNPAS